MSTERQTLFGMSASAKEQLLERMRVRKREAPEGVRQESAGAGVGSVEAASAVVPDSWCRFDGFPGYQQLRILKAAAEQL